MQSACGVTVIFLPGRKRPPRNLGNWYWAPQSPRGGSREAGHVCINLFIVLPLDRTRSVGRKKIFSRKKFSANGAKCQPQPLDFPQNGRCLPRSREHSLTQLFCERTGQQVNNTGSQKLMQLMRRKLFGSAAASNQTLRYSKPSGRRSWGCSLRVFVPDSVMRKEL